MTTAYLQIDKNVKITDTAVTLGKIARVVCPDPGMERKLKDLRISSSRITGPGRYVYSVADIIDKIGKTYPSVQVSNLGESDFVLTLEKKKQPSAVWQWMKTLFICVLSFFGAAFSIMAFNNDVGITNLFGQLYQLIMGTSSDGFGVLELSYSVGLGVGILLFFNHFAGKKLTADPTPLEVEMRLYEDEIDKTIIEAAGRQPQGDRAGE